MRQFLLAIIVLFIITNISFAQDIEFIFSDSTPDLEKVLTWHPPNEYRKAINLNGEWQYKINEKKPWRKTVIPSITEYQGEIILKKTFKVDSNYYNNHFKIICYGINYFCKIFINEQIIGSHSGGYTSFSLDIPQSIIKVGNSNTIEIRVKTELDVKSSIPLKNQILGQKNWGGIYREIYILAFPKITAQIDEVDYHLSEDYNAAEIQVSLEIRQHNLKYRAKENNKFWCVVELWEQNAIRPLLREPISIDKETELITPIRAKLNLRYPRLWSPENPDLYIIKVNLFNGKQIIDATSQSLGLKDFKIIKNNFYLNGQRLVLKGVTCYEQCTVHGKFLQPHRTEQYIEYIKELKANAVRVVGHPPHPCWVDLCDRQGLLLLEELPLSRVPTARLKSEQFLTRIKEYLTEVILRDRSHVSVLAWGMGEPTDSSANSVLNMLYDLAKQLDSRPCYNNNLNIKSEIISIDIFNNKNLLKQRTSSFDEKAAIISSFGNPLKEAKVEVDDPAVPQEIQALKIAETYKLIQQNDKLDGYFLNSLADWQCEYPLANYGIRKNSNIFPSGLLDYQGTKRLAFNAVRSLYLEGKTRTNPGLTIKVEHPGIFPLIGVISILIFLFIYNTRRYLRENLKRIFVHPHGFYVDLRDKRKIPVSHTLLIAIFSSLGLGLVTATFFYFYKENMLFDHLLTILSVNHSLKQHLIILCWKPELAILLFSIFFLITFAIAAIFIKFLAIIFRKKLPFSQSFTMVYWIGANYLLFVPIGMVLYRVLLLQSFFYPALIVLAVFDLWFLARLIKAIKVIFIWTELKAALFVLVVIAIFASGMIYYYQQNQGILDYLNFYVGHLLKVTGGIK